MLGAAKCLDMWRFGERGDWELLEFGTQRGNEKHVARIRELIARDCGRWDGAVPGEGIWLNARLPELQHRKLCRAWSLP